MVEATGALRVWMGVLQHLKHTLGTPLVHVIVVLYPRAQPEGIHTTARWYNPIHTKYPQCSADGLYQEHIKGRSVEELLSKWFDKI